MCTHVQDAACCSCTLHGFTAVCMPTLACAHTHEHVHTYVISTFTFCNPTYPPAPPFLCSPTQLSPVPSPHSFLNPFQRGFSSILRSFVNGTAIYKQPNPLDLLVELVPADHSLLRGTPWLLGTLCLLDFPASLPPPRCLLLILPLPRCRRAQLLLPCLHFSVSRCPASSSLFPP